MTAPNDMISDGIRTVSAVTYDLEHLARAFADTGNPIMAERLSGFAVELRDASKSISSGWSGECSDRLCEAQRGVADTLKALLGT